MTSAVASMLKSINSKNYDDYKNSLEEIIQQIILCGLSRSGFFLKAAFYNGAALHIFTGPDSFLQDMNFSLLTQTENFDPSYYFTSVRTELASCGFTMSMEKIIGLAPKETSSLLYVFYVSPLEPLVSGIAAIEKIQVNFILNKMPNDGITYESKYSLLPSPYSILLYDKPSLFSKTICDILFSKTQNRVTALSFFNYVWYLSEKTSINMEYIKSVFKTQITIKELKSNLIQHFKKTDFPSIKKEIQHFVKERSQIELWNADFFISITNQI